MPLLGVHQERDQHADHAHHRTDREVDLPQQQDPHDAVQRSERDERALRDQHHGRGGVEAEVVTNLAEDRRLLRDQQRSERDAQDDAQRCGGGGEQLCPGDVDATGQVAPQTVDLAGLLLEEQLPRDTYGVFSAMVAVVSDDAAIVNVLSKMICRKPPNAYPASSAPRSRSSVV